MTLHPQVRIHGERNGEVEVDFLCDVGIAPLIAALAERGYQTTGSCQHQEGTAIAWVQFKTELEAFAFAGISGGKVLHPREEDAIAMGDELDPNDPALHGAVGVAFPHDAIGAVLEALTRDGRVSYLPPENDYSTGKRLSSFPGEPAHQRAFSLP